MEDKSPGVGKNQNPEKRFSELTKLISKLSVKVKPNENNHLCLQPLLDESAALLGSGAAKPGLKKLVEKLLAMTEANMSLCYEKQSCSLTSILHSNHGVGGGVWYGMGRGTVFPDKYLALQPWGGSLFRVQEENCEES